MNNIISITGSNHEESSNDVDIGDQRVHSLGGKDTFGMDDFSSSKIIPIFFSDVFIDSSGLGIKFLLGHGFFFFSINIDEFTVNAEVSILIHFDKVFSVLESEGDDEGVNVDGAVRSLDVL